MSTPLKKSTPISKSLLTPCRRVGLSRIRKTPDSIAKLINHTPGASSNSPKDSPKTPASVKYKEALKPPLDSPLAEMLPASPSKVKSDLSLKCKETLLGKSGVGKAAKKSLEQKFDKECSDDSTNLDLKKQTKDKPSQMVSTMEAYTLTEVPKISKEKTSENRPGTVTKQSTVDEEDQSFVKIKKRKTRVLSDDSLPDNKNEICEMGTKFPTSEGVRKRRAQRVISDEISDVETNTCNKTAVDHPMGDKDKDLIVIKKKSRRVLAEDNLLNVPNEGTKKKTMLPTIDSIKKGKTSVLSKDGFPKISSIETNTCKITTETTISHDSFDEDFIVIKKKNRRMLSEDDFPEVSNSQKSTDSHGGKRLKKSEKSFKKKISIQRSLGEDGDADFVSVKQKIVNEESGCSTSSSQNLRREMSQDSFTNLSKIKTLWEGDLATHEAPEQLKGNNPIVLDDDDEAAFTSTPEEQRERADLMNNIGSLEIKIKEKTKMLDDLKRAATYKNKHNIDELQQLIEVWRKGCVVGLMALQEKLQAHSPISMETLLNNLHIPSEIAKMKLKL